MKSLLKVLSVFILFSLTLTNLYASPIVDQSQVNWLGGGWYVNSQRFFAQTFTCGISGQLSHIDILFDTWEGSPDYPSTFSIVNVVGGVPDGSVIGSVYTSGFSIGWNTIDFLSEGIFLNKDTQYAIHISNDDPDSEIPPSLGLGLDYDNNYSGGMMWWYSGWSGIWSNEFDHSSPGETDGVFVTWMIPGPETLSGWVFMPPDVPDFGYSLNEEDLVYFYSFDFVQSFNLDTGGWSIHMPTDLVYVDWPFYYESDPGALWFALPPAGGIGVYHFSTGEWEILPRIIP